MRIILAAPAAAVAAVLLSMGAAQAHSFNVALLVGPAAGDAGQIRDGFLLATRERDSHPDEVSDGHLGGLDVYLTLVEARDDPLAAVRALLEQTTIDILAVIGPDLPVEALRPLADRARTVLLTPDRKPFLESAGAAGQAPAVRAFVAAFEAAYGTAPTPAAAQGYNAARRIDAAVRAQGGVADQAALRDALAASEKEFDW